MIYRPCDFYYVEPVWIPEIYPFQMSPEWWLDGRLDYLDLEETAYLWIPLGNPRYLSYSVYHPVLWATVGEAVSLSS